MQVNAEPLATIMDIDVDDDHFASHDDGDDENDRNVSTGHQS